MSGKALGGGTKLEHLDHMQLTYDPARGTATLTLSRPEKMNIVSMLARSQIKEVFEDLDQDDSVRVVIVRGAGERAFSSGGDVAGFLEYGPHQLIRLHENIASPGRCLKPVIAAIDGYCMGVGLELALACDILIGTTRSVFALPEIRLGMIPGSGGSQRLAQLIGFPRTKYLTMTGRRFSGEEAYQWGVLSLLVEPDGLDGAVDEVVDELVAHSPVALKVLKQVFNSAQGGLHAGMIAEGLGYGLLRSTQDFQEGVRAFAEKRKPQFRGE